MRKRLGLCAHSAEDAAGSLLGFEQAREERAHGKPFRVTCMYSCQERLGEIVERLCSEASANERCDGLVVLSRQPRHRDFACHAELAPPGEEWRTGQRTQADRETKKGPFRERPEDTIAEDVRSSRRRRRDEAMLQPQFAAQRDARRLLHEKRVRPRVHGPAIEPVGIDNAASPVGSFEQADVDAAEAELIGGCQAGNAAPDDGDVSSCRGYLPRLETL